MHRIEAAQEQWSNRILSAIAEPSYRLVHNLTKDLQLIGKPVQELEEHLGSCDALDGVVKEKFLDPSEATLRS